MKYVVNSKSENLAMLNRQMLVKTLSMFEWENLPPTIPKKELERQLQTMGYSFITEVKGELYAFTGGLGGETDVYGNPTEIIINNVALNFNETLSLKDDGVLIYNDDLMIGLLPVFTRYNSMIVENDINLSMLGLSSRSKIGFSPMTESSPSVRRFKNNSALALLLLSLAVKRICERVLNPSIDRLMSFSTIIEL